MSLVSINWKPDATELRKFGMAILVGFGFIGALCCFQIWPFNARSVDVVLPQAQYQSPEWVQASLPTEGAARHALKTFGLTLDSATGRVWGTVPRTVKGGRLIISVGDPETTTEQPVEFWSMQSSCRTAYWIWGIAGVVGVLGLTGTVLALPFYYAWMGVSFVLGNIMSRVIFGLFYYLMITPFGLAMRVMGRDKLRLRKQDADTYWNDMANTTPGRYERQF